MEILLQLLAQLHFVVWQVSVLCASFWGDLRQLCFRVVEIQFKFEIQNRRPLRSEMVDDREDFVRHVDKRDGCCCQQQQTTTST